MTGQPINQDRWPANGPYRRFLKHLDHVHKANGLKSLRAIGQAIPLSHTAVNQILTGQRLPADEKQVSSLARALGGSLEDSATAEVLYQAARNHDNRRKSRDIRPLRKIMDLPTATAAVADNQLIHIDDLLQPAIDQIEAIETASLIFEPLLSIPTRFSDFDLATGGGLALGQLTVVAGQPSVGKSTLVLNFARSCAIETKWPCAFFNLELNRDELLMRMFASEANIRMVDIRYGRMNDDAWARMARRASELIESPLHVDDSASISIGQIEQRVRELSAESGLKLVVIDYLELIAPSPRQHSADATSERLSRRLKLLAKQLMLAVVVVTQVGLELSPTSFGRPSLADIREASLVEDADVIILLHRPDAFDRDSPRAGEADLIVAKNRTGPIFAITIAHQLHYGRFTDL